MPRDLITTQKILDHVHRLGEQHPPIPLASVDFTVNSPVTLRTEYGHVLEYLSRVELEVDRNVLELLTLLPNVEEADRYFYADVWQPQEIQHGILLDQLQQEIGLAPSEPKLEIQPSMKILGAMSHLPAIHEVTRLLYYLTGASTERQAVLAYNTLVRGLDRIGEPAIGKTLITKIKQQEPGHFAFYQMSATSMIQHGVLKPWQLFLAQTLRRMSFTLVGVDGEKKFRRDMGGVMVALGIDHDLAGYAKEIGRLEARLLWANRNGMEFPPYVLRELRESLEMYREKGLGTTGRYAGAMA